jgi:hypothetical protein
MAYKRTRRRRRRDRLRVVEKEDAIANDRSVETGRYRVEAESTMADIQSRNHDNKAINLILEFSIGKVNKVIDDMVSSM